MRKQRNMSEMKVQDKISAKDLNEMEICDMPDREFQLIIIKILTELEKTSVRPSTKRYKTLKRKR